MSEGTDQDAVPQRAQKVIRADLFRGNNRSVWDSGVKKREPV